MVLENPLFLTPFLAGSVFLVMGFFTLKFPPKKINSFYGYRTPSSMKSKDRRIFAQKIGARQMLKGGVILLLVSAPGFFYYPTQGIGNLLGLGEVIGILLAMILKVERALNSRFDD